MTLQEIADELVAGVRDNRTRENLDRLYAADAVSVEAADMGGPREARGIDAIRAKHDWWESNMDVQKADVAGPMLHLPDRFACYFTMTVKEQATGKITDHFEVGVYTVAQGRITREEFYYPLG
ncbi:MAG: SnoaL-like domain-containing protein [Jannaschia sp.]